MSDCPICQLIEGKTLTLFEDEHVSCMVAPEPVAGGHIIVAPKQHAPIIEAIPNQVVSRMFVVANKMSMGIFEAVGAQGTNLIVQNGLPAGQSKPHCLVNIIPRREGDNLKLEWQPGNVSEEENGRAELLLKDAAAGISVKEKEKPKPFEETKPTTIDVDETDYRARQLRRIP